MINTAAGKCGPPNSPPGFFREFFSFIYGRYHRIYVGIWHNGAPAHGIFRQYAFCFSLLCQGPLFFDIFWDFPIFSAVIWPFPGGRPYTSFPFSLVFLPHKAPPFGPLYVKNTVFARKLPKKSLISLPMPLRYDKLKKVEVNVKNIWKRYDKMFTAKEFVKVKSLEEAWELNQRRSNKIVGGMMWLKMSKLPEAICRSGTEKV